MHQGGVLNERPHVVFPGNLQGRHIRETGPKSAYLVTVDDGELTELSPIHTDVVRWALLPVPVDGCTQLNEVVDRVRVTIENAIDRDSDGRLLACRIELTGRGEIHGRLLAAREYLLAEARGAVLGLGEEAAWIERVVIASQTVVDPATLRGREDAMGELQRMLEGAGEDEDLHERLKADIGRLVSGLPHELRAESEDAVLKAAIDGEYDGLVGEMSGYLMARITAQGQ